MTAFKFCPAGYALNAKSITANQSLAFFNSAITTNSPSAPFWTLGINRSLWITRAIAGSNLNFIYDLGTSVDRTFNYLIIKKANLLNLDLSNPTVTIQRSADGISYTDIDSVSLTGSTIYQSPALEDYLLNLGALETDDRYIRIKLDVAGTSRFKTTGFYFGQFVEFQNDPSDIRISLEKTNGTWISESGRAWSKEFDSYKYKIQLFFEGVTNEQIFNFYRTIAKTARKSGVFLHTTNSTILDGFEVLHCALVKFNHEEIEPNYNLVSVELLEL